ncbi:sugar ABC transporter permease [Butyrivibrio sp. VCD2006]|uniref:sugar ABC transporter permease n=1 Tax=Butyrivibrio sp. VCD2006 TaxID=1280664 RepID=UPI00040EE889|nr:ABC transporter permease subunit [Butyrivibrio sp. VCD2006]
MKKVVIGLNLDFHLKALIGIFASVICMFVSFVKSEYGYMNMISTCMYVLTSDGKSKAYFILLLATVLTIISAVLGVISLVKTTVPGMKIWQYVQGVNVVFWTLLLFAGKSIYEKAGLSGTFLNKNYSFGMWFGLFFAYFTLVMIMRVTQTNVGYIALTILGIIWLFPILWIVLTAFRAEQGYYVGYFIPHGFTLDNFKNLFSNQSVLPFGKWWVNTMIVAVCSCVINTLIILATSYVLSRTRFRGRKGFMNVLMIIGMFPGFMSLIAVYNILKGIGLNQSLMALIVVGAAGAAMGYHVSKGFFDTIPKAVDEAAIIDGASRFQIFTHITLPLSKSIIVYTVLGNFLGAWSDYIFPSMLFGDKQSSYTVAVGLYWLTDFKRIDTYYTQFAAGAVVVAIPIVILFIWLQRFYVEGLSGSVKG